MIRVCALIVCICALTMFFGCGGDGGGGPTRTAASVTAEGWTLFEDSRYGDAKDKFDEALALDDTYADAYNGLGWSNAKLDLLAEWGSRLINLADAFDMEKLPTVLHDYPKIVAMLADLITVEQT